MKFFNDIIENVKKSINIKLISDSIKRDNGQSIFNSAISGFKNLLGLGTQDGLAGRNSPLGFITRFIGGFFGALGKFAEMIFGKSQDPATKEIVKGVKEVTTQANKLFEGKDPVSTLFNAVTGNGASNTNKNGTADFPNSLFDMFSAKDKGYVCKPRPSTSSNTSGNRPGTH